MTDVLDEICLMADELDFFNHEVIALSNKNLCKAVHTTNGKEEIKGKLERCIKFIKTSKCLPKRDSDNKRERSYFSIITNLKGHDNAYYYFPELQKELKKLIKKYGKVCKKADKEELDDIISFFNENQRWPKSTGSECTMYKKIYRYCTSDISKSKIRSIYPEQFDEIIRLANLYK